MQAVAKRASNISESRGQERFNLESRDRPAGFSILGK
jgi:hypothetical protein